jgi:DNA polymerase-3 subunit delta'
MRLAEVIGQGAVATLTARLQARDRLPHAILLEGVPGCGRRTLATAIAQAVLCASPHQGDACGTCDSCRMVTAGSHPDLVSTPHDTEPTAPSVDLVREQVVEAAFSSPLVGAHRVFILPGIERWNHQAANTLLKVLEEPPSSVRFVATTHQATAVLRTIRSRCQLYRLQPLSAVDVEQVLMRGGIAAGEARRRAVAAVGGHRGLWHGAPPIPLDALLRLAREGYRSALVAEAMALLPLKIDPAAEEAGLTLAAEQRRTVRVWLAALAQALRADLRQGGDEALRTVERIQRLSGLTQDLARNLQPRLILEAIGLGETERLLRRTGA